MALLGPALLALSLAFPWVRQGTLSRGPIYATDLRLPLPVWAPTVAQILAVLAVGASGLILVRARWADILRWVLGAGALILGGLFAWGFTWLVAGSAR